MKTSRKLQWLGEFLRTGTRVQLSYEEELDYGKAVNQLYEQQAVEVMPELANMGESPSDIASFRHICGTSAFLGSKQWHIYQCSDAELIAFRDELRKVWDQAGGWQDILNGWYFPFEVSNWFIFFKAKTILPAPKNFRGMVANTCAARAEYLKRCANPECRRYFIADRKDGKYCLQRDCIQYGGRIRAREHWRRTYSKSSSRRKGKRG